jgi:hypothetical protein
VREASGDERHEEGGMGGRLRWVVVLAGVLLLAQGCASEGAMQSASSPAGTQSTLSYGIYGVDSYFKLEWRADERRGKPIVSGYVTNQWGYAVRNLRLRVEALDAAGGMTASYIGYVNGYANPGSHIYFEVPVNERAPQYRVTVLSYDPVMGYGGG